MKFATLRDGSRDGALAVVSRDLTKAVVAETAVAGLRTLQQLMDNWPSMQAAVAALYAQLNEFAGGATTHLFATMAFKAGNCAAALPRAYQWADCSAYVNHVDLVRRGRGAEMPASFWTDPLIYQASQWIHPSSRKPRPWPRLSGIAGKGLNLPQGPGSSAARAAARIAPTGMTGRGPSSGPSSSR